MDIYFEMLDNDEVWVVSPNGHGMVVSDAALMDC